MPDTTGRRRILTTTTQAGFRVEIDTQAGRYLGRVAFPGGGGAATWRDSLAGAQRAAQEIVEERRDG